MPQISLHTPLGDLTISEQDGTIVSLDWGWGRDQASTSLLDAAKAQLQDYFDGARQTFDLPLNPPGTAYQRNIWRALCRIPPGQTRTYGQVAREAGGAARSVGQANGANPIPILIPCHRVTATSGIGGYSGEGGVATKLWLLELERRGLSHDDAALTIVQKAPMLPGLQWRQR